MDDLEVALFLETPIFTYIYHKIKPTVGKYTVRPMDHILRFDIWRDHILRLS